MNDYKFHKIFFCLVLLIVKFGVPCHAQSQSFTAKAAEDTENAPKTKDGSEWDVCGLNEDWRSNYQQ